MVGRVLRSWSTSACRSSGSHRLCLSPAVQSKSDCQFFAFGVNTAELVFGPPAVFAYQFNIVISGFHDLFQAPHKWKVSENCPQHDGHFVRDFGSRSFDGFSRLVLSKQKRFVGQTAGCNNCAGHITGEDSSIHRRFEKLFYRVLSWQLMGPRIVEQSGELENPVWLRIQFD